MEHVARLLHRSQILDIVVKSKINFPLYLSYIEEKHRFIPDKKWVLAQSFAAIWTGQKASPPTSWRDEWNRTKIGINQSPFQMLHVFAYTDEIRWLAGREVGVSSLQKERGANLPRMRGGVEFVDYDTTADASSRLFNTWPVSNGIHSVSNASQLPTNTFFLFLKNKNRKVRTTNKNWTPFGGLIATKSKTVMLHSADSSAFRLR